MRNLPEYVNDLGHGDISYEVPLAISGVNAYSFALSVHRKKLQVFIDSQLNGCSDGEITFKALPFIFFCAFNAEHCTSTTQNIGWLPDQESAFLIPLLQHRKGHLLPELTVWIPYLFIDQICGMVTGREVWGYRKMLAKIDVPKNPMKADKFSVDTMLFKKFSPQTEGEWGRLLELTNDGVLDSLKSIWEHPEKAFREVLEMVGSKLGVEELLLTEEVTSHFLKKPEFPVTCLKQYRDPVDSTKACYQSFVYAPIRLEKWYGGGILPGKHKLKITTCDSHQIVNDLGLGDVGADSTTVEPLFAMWWKMDFTTLDGDILWQAPNT